MFNRAPSRRTTFWRHTPGRSTGSGTSGSPKVPRTRPRRGTASSTAISVASIAWGSSPASTGPPSGGTRRLSSPLTTSCNTSTAPAPARAGLAAEGVRGTAEVGDRRAVLIPVRLVVDATDEDVDPAQGSGGGAGPVPERIGPRDRL